MILKEWEVWLTYSMYLSGGIRNLHAAATNMVESGLSDVASASDGFAAFRNGSEVRTGHLGMDVAPDSQKARISLPEGISHFEADGLVQTAMMRFSETRLFAEESPILPPYVRAQLGECWAHTERAATLFYPSVKLYENGVILVEIRMFSPEEPVELASFIDNIVNAYTLPFERLETQIGLATLLPRAILLSGGLSLRDRLRVHSALPLEADVADRGRSSDSTDFSFNLADLELPEELRPNTISEFAQLVASTVGYAVSNPREGSKFVVLDQRSILRVEGSWVGRPHVHLIDFEDQQDGARANEAKHGNSLGWIMARHSGSDGDEGRAQLPPSLRLFDDYGAYVNSALTLWVQSKSSVERSIRSSGDQRNLSEVVYEQQATAEMLDFGYMIHRRFTERASAMTASTEQVLAAQRDLIGLEAAMGEIGRYGEIRDLLRSAWDTLGVQRLREAAVRGLAVRQAEAATLEGGQMRRWASALAVVLGIGVVPSLAKDVVRPLWKWLGLLAPADPTTETIMFLGVAAAVVLLLLFSLRKWALR